MMAQNYVIRNILKANNTYTSDSWEKPLPSLIIRNITTLSNNSLRQNRDCVCAEKSSMGICHMRMSPSIGDTPTIYIPDPSKNGTCLTLCIIRYGSRVKCSNPGNGVVTSLHLGVVAIEKGAFGSPSTISCHLYFTINVIIQELW